ncbi:MAG TPA: PCRF domain-containing protein, partial [Candidatus Kapabacteria bacterium]|nr:PCRF domain-containing protein [Candidatus Kapabacteria bacterium]
MDTQELLTSLETLRQTLDGLRAILRLDEKERQIATLQEEVSAPDFWKDQENAQKKSKKLSLLEHEKEAWERLSKTVADLLEMAQLHDAHLQGDIEQQYEQIRKEVEVLEFQALMDGKYDDHGAIVSLHAGAGGTEAQDWAEMLTRMLFRYCEKRGWKTTLLDETRGQEAGIKSIVFRVEGDYAYGHLKSEHGTHRLVRISPFNADKLRQTSFAQVEVIPEMEASEMATIDPKDLRIDTFMAG